MSAARKKDKRFYFKQFSVRHDRSGMKVGTDGVLLGAWTDVTEAKNILDVGTGTGVIALMLAQRTDAQTKIGAVEIHEEAYEDAQENFNTSPWKDKLSLHLKPIQDFSSHIQFDLIVTNPPYFLNSYKPPSLKRETARHTESLSFEALLIAADTLLSEEGKLSLILPDAEGKQFMTLAEQKGFTCSRKWSFRSRAHKPIERWLLEFKRKDQSINKNEGEIILYNLGENWSSDYQNLTKEFYLKG